LWRIVVMIVVGDVSRNIIGAPLMLPWVLLLLLLLWAAVARWSPER
jgi:hypothetical protein